MVDYVKFINTFISRYYTRHLQGLVLGLHKNKEEIIMGSKEETNFGKIRKGDRKDSGKIRKEDEAQELIKEK
jgi:hypothetical protein